MQSPPSPTLKPASPPPAYTEHVEGEASQQQAQPFQPSPGQYAHQLPPQQSQHAPYTHAHPQAPYVHHHYSQPYPQSPYSPLSHPHAVYGPTPIAQQEAVLIPYFDPRSAFSAGEAARRARWRFLLAVLYAWAILVGVGLVTGVEVRIASS